MIVHKLRISRSESNSPEEREFFQWQFVNRNQFFMHSFFVNYSILIFIAFLMILLMLLIFLWSIIYCKLFTIFLQRISSLIIKINRFINLFLYIYSASKNLQQYSSIIYGFIMYSSSFFLLPQELEGLAQRRLSENAYSYRIKRTAILAS